MAVMANNQNITQKTQNNSKQILSSNFGFAFLVKIKLFFENLTQNATQKHLKLKSQLKKKFD